MKIFSISFLILSLAWFPLACFAEGCADGDYLNKSNQAELTALNSCNGSNITHFLTVVEKEISKKMPPKLKEAKKKLEDKRDSAILKAENIYKETVASIIDQAARELGITVTMNQDQMIAQIESLSKNWFSRVTSYLGIRDGFEDKISEAKANKARAIQLARNVFITEEATLDKQIAENKKDPILKALKAKRNALENAKFSCKELNSDLIPDAKKELESLNNDKDIAKKNKFSDNDIEQIKSRIIRKQAGITYLESRLAYEKDQSVLDYLRAEAQLANANKEFAKKNCFQAASAEKIKQMEDPEKGSATLLRDSINKLMTIETNTISKQQFNLSSIGVYVQDKDKESEQGIFGKIVGIVNFFILFSGVLAVLGITIGGVIIMVSMNDDTILQKGKNTIYYSVIGLVAVLLSYFIVTTIQTVVLSVAEVQAAAGNKIPDIPLLQPIQPGKTALEIPQPVSNDDRGYSVRILEAYLQTLYPYIVGLISAIAVFMVALGGIQITLGGGDSGKVTEGKDRIMYAIGGLLLLIFASLILYTINPTFFAFLGN